MSDRDLERGPQGDHGQHGDTGDRGIPGAMGPQGERGPRGLEFTGWSFARLLAFVLVAFAAIFSYAQAYEASQDANDATRRATAAIAQIKVESRERRGQICQSFEGQHLSEVTQLERTYAYVRSLTPDEVDSSLNKTIIAGIPELESKAKSDQDTLGVFVPKYCDDPNTGLPEPDPIVPVRPVSVDKLIKALPKAQ